MPSFTEILQQVKPSHQAKCVLTDQQWKDEQQTDIRLENMMSSLLTFGSGCIKMRTRDLREIRVGRLDERESQVIEVPVVCVVDINVANWHVVKQTVVRVDDDGLTAGLRRTVIGALNNQRELLLRPLLWHTVVANIHMQSV